MYIYNYKILAKYPPSAGFPSPFGGVAPSVPPLGVFGGGKRQIKKNWGALGAPFRGRRRRPMILKTSAGS